MSDFDDLINEFGSKNKTAKAVDTPYADLIDEFGSGEVKAIQSKEKGDVVGTKVGQASNVPFTYVPSGAPINDIQYYRNPEVPEPKVEFRQPSFSELPVIRQGIKGFQESGKYAGEGYSDIARGMSATGVGKVILGHVGQALNVTGVAPAIEAAKEQVTKATGNPDFADRLELVSTSGLPIAKTAKVVTELSPSTRAVKTIAEAIGPENIPSVVNQLKSNPRLTLMDVDPNVQIISQGLASKPGEPRNILDKVVKERKDTQKGTVLDIYDEALGVPVNVRDKVERLKTKIKETGKEINPVISNAGAVNISPVISSIDAKLKPGVQTVISAGEPLPLDDIQKSLKGVRKLLTDDKSVRTDAQSLHNFQSALRAKAEDLLSSQNGQDRQLGHALMNIRNQIVTSIDNAAGGNYKPALAKYRDINDVNDAFKKGQLITRNRLGNLDDDPSYWDNWIKTASPEELEAAREGARLAVSHQMGSVVNAARKGMNIPEIEFNAEKLKSLFGKEEVEKMAKGLADEKKIADTNSKLFQNSQTAMRLLGAEATEVRPSFKPNYTGLLPIAAEGLNQYLTGGSLPIALAGGYGYLGARKAITKIGQNLDRKTNVEIANLSSAVGEARENLIKALQDHIPKGKLTMKQRLQLSLPIQGR